MDRIFTKLEKARETLCFVNRIREFCLISAVFFGFLWSLDRLSGSGLFPLREGIACLIVFLATLAVLVVKLCRLVINALKPASLISLANQIDRKRPDFNDGLACAVELVEKKAGRINAVEECQIQFIVSQSESVDFIGLLTPK